MTGYEISALQKRHWQYAGSDALSFRTCRLVLRRSIDIDRMREGWELLCQNHDMLSMKCRAVEGQVFPMLTGRSAKSNFHVHRGGTGQEAQLHDLADGASIHFFLPENEPVEMCIQAPSLLLDAEAMFQVAEAMLAYHRGALHPLLEEDPVKYLQFSDWQQELLTDTEGENILFWRSLANLEASDPALPFDRDEKAAPGSGRVEVDLSAEETSGIHTLAGKHKVEPGTVLLGIWNLLFYRLTNDNTIKMAWVTGKGTEAELASAVGFFERQLPLVSKINGTDDFPTLLVQLQAHKDECTNHRFHWVTGQEAGSFIPASPEPPGLQFQFMKTSLESADREVTIEIDHWEGTREPAGISLCLCNTGARITGHLTFRTDVLHAEEAKRLLAYFRTLLGEVLADAERQADDFRIVPAEEEQKLRQWGEGEPGIPVAHRLHEIFEARVSETPHREALVFKDTRWTYEALNQRANELAQVLMNDYGIGRGKQVAIMANRTDEPVWCLFAVLKTGAAFVMIDPGDPPARLRHMVHISNCALILGPGRQKDMVEGFPFLATEEAVHSNAHADNPHTHGHPADLAYVIFTSGTTGDPKGVMISHASVFNLAEGLHRKYLHALGEHANVGMTGRYTFDVFVQQLFGALSYGHTLHVFTEEMKQDPNLFLQYLIEHRIDHFDLTPAMLLVLLDADEVLWRDYPAHITIVGGDMLKYTMVERFFRLVPRQDACLLNLYGPTECTVYCTGHYIDRYNMADPPPIGTSLPGSRAYVLNRSMQFVPRGVKGEVYMGGAGIGLGYIGREDLTRQYFMGNPFVPGDPMYRTGDVCHWNGDGNLVPAGRTDHQVKIRGFRIELSAIEWAFQQHPEVLGSVVLVKRDGQGQDTLVAFVRTQAGTEIEGMKEHLATILPDYMYPGQVYYLDQFPLNNNTKVDRAALLKRLEQEQKQPAAQSQTAMEILLAEILRHVLGEKGSVDLGKDFFQLGGDSIKAIQLASSMFKKGFRLEVKDIFQAVSMQCLAAGIEPVAQKVKQDREYVGHYPLTPIQEAFFREVTVAPFHYNQSMMLRASEPLNEEALRETLDTLCKSHAALRTVFRLHEGRMMGQVLPEITPAFRVCDLGRDGGTTALEQVANEEQRSIDLEQGPLMRVVLFRLPDEDKLLIICHHLIIDAVSWSILMEDLEDVYHACLEGKKPVPVQVTASFGQWALFLDQCRTGWQQGDEPQYWAGVDRSQHRPITPEYSEGKNPVSDKESLHLTLKPELTRALQTEANRPYRTTAEEILLAGLAAAFREVFDRETLCVFVENNGRNVLENAPDINRTIGWFTSLFPVVFDSGATEPGALLRTVKETLRAVPQHGIGYGLWCYKNNEGKHTLPHDISFNYFGSSGGAGKGKYFKPVRENTGIALDPAQERKFLLETAAIIHEGQLHLMLFFGKAQFSRATIETLLEAWRIQIETLVEHCIGIDRRILTPSDLAVPGLDADTLAALSLQYDLEDIYPLTPMQQSMLVQTAFGGTSSFFEQVTMQIRGHLDPQLIRESLEVLYQRHEILRTAFLYEGYDRPWQMVLRKRETDFHFEDLRHLPAMEARKARAEAYRHEDLLDPFDLSGNRLLRLAILRLDDDLFQMVWSNHHILEDGWSFGIWMAEMIEIYYAKKENRAPVLPKGLKFRQYLEWLAAKDKGVALAYWRQYLSGYSAVSPVPTIKQSTQVPDALQPEWSFMLYEEARALHTLAEKLKVTLNALLQSVWGIVLAAYNDRSDVVFGYVTSGRPAELEGIEHVCGLFLNVLPARVRFDETTTFSEVVRQMSADLQEGSAYEYESFSEIQKASALPLGLIDHVVVFQNFMVTDILEGVVDGQSAKSGRDPLKVLEVRHHGNTNFDFGLLITPGPDAIRIRFKYHPDAFDEGLLQNIQDNIIHVIRCALETPTIAVQEISLILTEEEQAEIRDLSDQFTAEF